MKSWWFPDGFVGDDFVSKHNARWMAVFGIWAIVVWLLAMFMVYCHAAGSFPPISYIAAELNISAGQTLPKGVVWNGRPVFFYVKWARQLSDGEYDVRIKAR